MASEQCQPAVLVGVITCLDLMLHAQKVMEVCHQRHQQQPPHHQQHQQQQLPQPQQASQGLLEQALAVILRMWGPSQIPSQNPSQNSSQILSQNFSQMARQMSYTQELVVLRVLQVTYLITANSHTSNTPINTSYQPTLYNIRTHSHYQPTLATNPVNPLTLSTHSPYQPFPPPDAVEPRRCAVHPARGVAGPRKSPVKSPVKYPVKSPVKRLFGALAYFLST